MHMVWLLMIKDIYILQEIQPTRIFQPLKKRLTEHLMALPMLHMAMHL